MKIIQENKFLHNLIYGNRVRIICYFFTLATLLDVVLSLAFDGSTDHWHLANRFIIVTLVAFSLIIFRLIQKVPLIAVIILHFIICVAIMVLSTWINGFVVELHPRAYYYAIRSIFIIYPIIIVGGIISTVFQKSKNKIEPK